MKRLYEKFKNNDEIKFSYAQILSNLAYTQNKNYALKTIEKIREIYEKNQDSLKLSKIYFDSLFCISILYNLQDMLNSLEKAKKIYDKYPKNKYIVRNYLHQIQELKWHCFDKEYKLLYEQYENSIPYTDIDKPYKRYIGKNIVDIYFLKKLNILETVEKIYNNDKSNQDSKYAYSTILYDLSSHSDIADMNKIIEKLKNLYDENKNLHYIKINYLGSLGNLSTLQENKDEFLKTFHQIQEFYQKNKDDLDIAIIYAIALFNLSTFQNEDEVLDTLKTLYKLQKEFMKSDYIAYEICLVLYNLTFTKNLKSKLKAVDRLGEIYDIHKKDSDIALIYAKSLFRLLLSEIDKKEKDQIKEKLKLIYEQHNLYDKLIELYKKQSKLHKYKNLYF